MQSLSSSAGVDLEWVQSGLLARRYELRASDAVFAELAWQGSFGSLATAETESARYTFKRAGFLRPRVTVRLSGAKEDHAVLYPGWRGDGPLTIAGIRHYAWANTGFWQAAWGFSATDGQRIVQFRPKLSLARKVTGVEVASEALANPDVPLLLAFGWYLLVMMAEEAASVLLAMS